MSSAPSEHTPSPTFFGRIADYIDWKANPVLLRDLQLYARGKMLAAGYLLILAALMLLAILYAIVASLEIMDGQTLLSILSTMLIISCGAIVPNLVFERFRTELANRATELALMSPLTPARLVRGKLVGAWCITLMIVSIAAPVLATAYLLGGVGMLAILGVVGSTLLAGAVMPSVQLFLATRKRGKGVTRVVASLAFIGQIILMSSFASLVNSTFINVSWNFDVQVALMASVGVGGLLAGQFLYFVTVGRLRGESEDRDAAPRLSLAFAAWAGFASAIAISLYLFDTTSPKDHVPLFAIAGYVAAFAAYAFCCGFQIVAYTNPVLPRRLRQDRSAPRRFFLTPGLRSLTAFFLANAVPLILLSFGVLESEGYDDRDAWRIVCLAMAPFMAIATGLCAHYYIVLPFMKDRRDPALLPNVIAISNFVLGIVFVFLMVVASYVESFESVFNAIVGLNPIGLIYAGLGGWNQARDSGPVGVVAMVVLLFALLPVVLGSRADQAGRREARADGAE